MRVLCLAGGVMPLAEANRLYSEWVSRLDPAGSRRDSLISSHPYGGKRRLPDLGSLRFQRLVDEPEMDADPLP